RTIVVNNTFIHQYNFNTTRIENIHGTTTWAHDPVHRAGVPYSNTRLQQQFRSNVRQNVAPRAIPAPARAQGAQPMERFGDREIPQNTPPAKTRGALGEMQNGSAAQTHKEHGMPSLAPTRTMPAPRPAAPAVRSAPAPKSPPAKRSAPPAKSAPAR